MDCVCLLWFLLFCVLTFIALLIFHSWELRAPRPAPTFCLIKKWGKNHSISIRVRIRKTVTTIPNTLRRAAARRRMSFMSGCAIFVLRLTLNVLGELFLKHSQSWARRKARQCFGAVLSALFQGSEWNGEFSFHAPGAVAYRRKNSFTYVRQKFHLCWFLVW